MSTEHIFDDGGKARPKPSQETADPQMDNSPLTKADIEGKGKLNANTVRKMQQTMGNAAVQRLLAQRSASGPSEVDDETSSAINSQRGGGHSCRDLQRKAGTADQPCGHGDPLPLRVVVRGEPNAGSAVAWGGHEIRAQRGLGTAVFGARNHEREAERQQRKFGTAARRFTQRSRNKEERRKSQQLDGARRAMQRAGRCLERHHFNLEAAALELLHEPFTHGGVRCRAGEACHGHRLEQRSIAHAATSRATRSRSGAESPASGARTGPPK